MSKTPGKKNCYEIVNVDNSSPLVWSYLSVVPVYTP